MGQQQQPLFRAVTNQVYIRCTSKTDSTPRYPKAFGVLSAGSACTENDFSQHELYRGLSQCTSEVMTYFKNHVHLTPLHPVSLFHEMRFHQYI